MIGDVSMADQRDSKKAGGAGGWRPLEDVPQGLLQQERRMGLKLAFPWAA
jgi:hypothetical protein